MGKTGVILLKRFGRGCKPRPAKAGLQTPSSKKPFIIHHSSFTIHHSPFIIHHSPLF